MTTLKEKFENLPAFDGLQAISQYAEQIITLTGDPEAFLTVNLEKINSLNESINSQLLLLYASRDW